MGKQLFIQPIDVLYLRGNRLFAGANHAGAVMPPWPTVFAGALRSRIMVDQRVDFHAFRDGNVENDEVLAALGTPQQPGAFRITALALAEDGSEADRALFPAPQDLACWERNTSEEPHLHAEPLRPVPLGQLGLRGSFPLPQAPVVRTSTQAKVTRGVWITEAGLRAHLAGDAVASEHLKLSDTLWGTDRRLGIALSSATRSAEDGMLYTTDAVAPREKIGFAVGVSGGDTLLPTEGLLRLGGDGRGASVRPWRGEALRFPIPDSERFRMILATPGCFGGGWIPPGVEQDGAEYVLRFQGLEAKLLAAAVSRGETISGWDLVKRRPKPAERVVPTGSVYWFERTAGDGAPLERLAKEGLWAAVGDLDGPQLARRAEGFNNVWFGEWA